MSIETLLCDEIEDELGELNKLAVGDESYKTTVDGVTKLVDRVIELRKLEKDRIERFREREEDIEYRNAQMEEERKDRLIKNILTGAGIILPVGLTIWGTIKSFEFEKEGTVTTIMGRGFINKLLKK